jgi:hypothetical protein
VEEPRRGVGSRHSRAQQSFRLGAFGLSAAFGIRQPCEHIPQVAREDEARFGQDDPAGRALDETLADAEFQRGDAPADGGLGDPQFARGRSEAAAVDYREKSLCLGKAGSIHAFIGFMISVLDHINPPMATISQCSHSFSSRLQS